MKHIFDFLKFLFYHGSDFFRSLRKMELNESIDEALLPKCVLLAILNGHYHIANHIVCGDNYEKAFYSVFPDGCVPAKFFAVLLQNGLIEGERIAISLLNYFPKLNIKQLRGDIERDEFLVKNGVLKRFDSFYKEVMDLRNYPYDID